MLKDDIQYTLPVDVTASVHQLNKDNYTVKSAFVLFPEAVKIDKKVSHLKMAITVKRKLLSIHTYLHT